MNSWLLPETSILMHSIGWALLYSLWQGLLFYSVLKISLKLLKNASARARYNLSFLLFSCLFICFIDTWITHWQYLQTISVQVTESSVNSDLPGTLSLNTLVPPVSQNPALHSILPEMEKYMPVIVSIYLSGLILTLMRFILGIYQVRVLRTKGVGEPVAELMSLLIKWQKQLNINFPVQFLVSRRINIPMVTGIIKPVILIPISIISQLNPDQLEAILLHELSHIKRNDYLLNVIQTIIETILFFNPFVWLMSSIIREERENCCDDLVLANTSTALPYAKALAQLESYRSDRGIFRLAANGNKNHLFHRIKRIMEMKKNTTNYSQLTIILVLLITLFVSAMWLTPGFAQKTKVKEDTTNIKNYNTKTVSRQKIVIIDDNGNEKEYDSIDKLPKEEKEKLKKELKDVDLHANKIVKDKKKEKKEEGENNTEDFSAVFDNAFNSVDWNKIGKDLNEAMKEVGKAMKETSDSMKKVDWDKISKDLQTKLEKIKKELPDTSEQRKIIIKNKEQIEERESKIFDEVWKEIQKDKVKIEQINEDIDANYTSANSSLVNSNIYVSAPAYDRMLKKMDSGGLIDQVNGYKIEKKGDHLFINDIEQTDAVFSRYKHYFKNQKVTIKGDKNHIKINVKD